MSERLVPVTLKFVLDDKHPLVKIFHEIPEKAQQEALLAIIDAVLDDVNANGSWCLLERVDD